MVKLTEYAKKVKKITPQGGIYIPYGGLKSHIWNL